MANQERTEYGTKDPTFAPSFLHTPAHQQNESQLTHFFVDFVVFSGERTVAALGKAFRKGRVWL